METISKHSGSERPVSVCISLAQPPSGIMRHVGDVSARTHAHTHTHGGALSLTLSRPADCTINHIVTEGGRGWECAESSH
jgi:hypothetical protein